MRYLTPALFLVSLSAVAQTWTQLPDLPGIERDDASAFVIGTDIYVGTGMDVGFQNTSDWYRFNTLNNTWSTVASLPATGRQYCSAFAFNGIGHLLGGYVLGSPSAEVFLYDPSLDQWNPGVALPEAVYASTSFTIDGTGYLCSGVLSNFLPSTLLWIYDAAAGSWSTGALIDTLPMSRAASFAHDGHGYVVGGMPVTTGALAGAWRYDPVADEWSGIEPLPAARNAADAVGVPDGGIVIGGQTPVPNAVYDNVWHYIAASDSWEDLPPFPAGGRRGAVIAFVPPNKVYYGTGSDNVQRYRDWWVLDLPVGMDETASAAAFTLFPTVADNEVSIRMSLNAAPTDVTITGLAGRLVTRARIAGGSTAISTAEWRAGVYLATVRCATGTSSRRFVVLH
jgi:N-acetylneuraminic acid mutarotase